MNNKTQSRFTYLSKRVNAPGLQVHLDNVPHLQMTPLRKKCIGVAPKMIQLGLIPHRQEIYPSNFEQFNQRDESPNGPARCSCLDCYEQKMTKRKVAMLKSPERSLSPRKINMQFDQKQKKGQNRDNTKNSNIYNRLMNRTITDKDIMKNLHKTKDMNQTMRRQRSRNSQCGFQRFRSVKSEALTRFSSEHSPQRQHSPNENKGKMARRYRKMVINYANNIQTCLKPQDKTFIKREKSCPRSYY